MRTNEDAHELIPECEAAIERALSRVDSGNPAAGYLRAVRELALVVEDQCTLPGYPEEAKADDLSLLARARDQFAAFLSANDAQFRADASQLLEQLATQLPPETACCSSRL